MIFPTIKRPPLGKPASPDPPIRCSYFLRIRDPYHLCIVRLVLAPYSLRSIVCMRFLHMIHCFVAGDPTWDVEGVGPALVPFGNRGDEAG